MAKFLKDEMISDVSIDDESIKLLFAVFVEMAARLDNLSKKEGEGPRAPRMHIVLRFDGKGYRIHSIDELLHYFNLADNVDRLNFIIQTAGYVNSNGESGDYLELRLDKTNAMNCILTASSDSKEWVDSSYSTVKEVLSRCKTKYHWARSKWANLSIQLMGVIAGFVLSLWVTSKVSDKLNVENAFIITFLFVLLLFSNAWGYINQSCLNYMHGLFPSIKFSRPNKDRTSWLLQAVIGGLVVALTLYLLSMMFDFVGGFIK